MATMAARIISASIQVIQTPKGVFHKSNESAGVWNYFHETKGSIVANVDEWIQDALDHRPEGNCWFWFNGTASPMFPGDTKTTLFDRWIQWRNIYQADSLFLADRRARFGF